MESFADSFDCRKLDPRLEPYRETFENAGMLDFLLTHQEWAIETVRNLLRKK